MIKEWRKTAVLFLVVAILFGSGVEIVHAAVGYDTSAYNTGTGNTNINITTTTTDDLFLCINATSGTITSVDVDSIYTFNQITSATYSGSSKTYTFYVAAVPAGAHTIHILTTGSPGIYAGVAGYSGGGGTAANFDSGTGTNTATATLTVGTGSWILGCAASNNATPIIFSGGIDRGGVGMVLSDSNGALSSGVQTMVWHAVATSLIGYGAIEETIAATPLAPLTASSTPFHNIFNVTDATTTQHYVIVDNPNQDLAMMIFFLLVGFYGTVWLIKPKQLV